MEYWKHKWSCLRAVFYRNLNRLTPSPSGNVILTAMEYIRPFMYKNLQRCRAQRQRALQNADGNIVLVTTATVIIT